MDKYLANFVSSDFLIANASQFQTNNELFSPELALPQSAIDAINARGGITEGGRIYGKTTAVEEFVTEDYYRQARSWWPDPDGLDARINAMERDADGLLAADAQLYGMESFALDRLTVLEGDLTKLSDPNGRYIAAVYSEDDYGEALMDSRWAKLGDTVTLRYVERYEYYDPATGSYGALGHGITDVDTAQLMPLASGSIMETTVKAVKKGAKGDPGELKGDFSVQRDVGTVSVNSDGGIFGTVADPDFLRAGTPVPVATARQVKTGPATILTTISNDDTAEYTVQIVRVFSGSQSTRNLLLKVTDQRLLDATGGIVQGMSGSPILQDGRIVGAVTHVLLNDPTQGYGILMENMLAMAG